MTRMLWAFVGAAVLVGPAGAAIAQDPGAPPPPPRGMGRMIEQRFAEMDLNHDGVVTRDEYDAYRARMRAERSDRMADRGPPPPGAGGMGYDPNGSGAPAPGGPLGYDPGNGANPPPGGPGMRGRRGMRPDWFARADLNHDGKVTLAEAQEAAREMMAERGGMRGQRGPGGPGGDMPPPPQQPQ